jgi:hypothetical protein
MVALQVQAMIQQAMRDAPLAATQQQQQQASSAAPTPQQQQQAQLPQPLLPLIRLRVDYSGFSTINSQRFGQRFVGKVRGVLACLLMPWQQMIQQRIQHHH